MQAMVIATASVAQKFLMQLEAHRRVGEYPRIHQLDCGVHTQLEIGERKYIALEIHSRRDFANRQSIVHEVDDAPFSDVADLLTSPPCHLAAERDMLDRRHQL